MDFEEYHFSPPSLEMSNFGRTSWGWLGSRAAVLEPRLSWSQLAPLSLSTRVALTAVKPCHSMSQGLWHSLKRAPEEVQHVQGVGNVVDYVDCFCLLETVSLCSPSWSGIQISLTSTFWVLDYRYLPSHLAGLLCFWSVMSGCWGHFMGKTDVLNPVELLR